MKWENPTGRPMIVAYRYSDENGSHVEYRKDTIKSFDKENQLVYDESGNPYPYRKKGPISDKHWQIVAGGILIYDELTTSRRPKYENMSYDEIMKLVGDTTTTIPYDEKTNQTWLGETKMKKINEVVSIDRKILGKLVKEQLNKYNSYDEHEAKADPKGAAADLAKLINTFCEAVEAALEKGGPYVAQQLLDDFQTDLSKRMKEIRLPDVSKLETIMNQVDEKDKEIRTKKAEKEEAEKRPPAKKPEEVPEEAPEEEAAPKEEEEEEIIFP